MASQNQMKIFRYKLRKEIFIRFYLPQKSTKCTKKDRLSCDIVFVPFVLFVAKNFFVPFCGNKNQ